MQGHSRSSRSVSIESVEHNQIPVITETRQAHDIMNCIAGHTFYLDTLQKNYKCQDFLLKFTHNVINKYEFL